MVPSCTTRRTAVGIDLADIRTPQRSGISESDLSFVPEDRLGMGLVGSMDMTDNMMLRGYKQRTHISSRTEILRKQLGGRSDPDELEIVTPGTTTPVRRLSGGNVQKVLVGREISSNPNSADGGISGPRT